MKDIKVSKIIDEFTLVLNYGAEDGAKKGQEFLIYSIGDEILDPDTHESLGNLEIVKGSGKVINIQPKMCTISSSTYRKYAPIITHRRNQLNLEHTETVEQVEPEQLPFKNAQVSDYAKLISY